jgi:hypothetical protein
MKAVGCLMVDNLSSSLIIINLYERNLLRVIFYVFSGSSSPFRALASYLVP